jgi:hypothetical protein
MTSNNDSNVISEGERQFVHGLLMEKHDRKLFVVACGVSKENWWFLFSLVFFASTQFAQHVLGIAWYVPGTNISCTIVSLVALGGLEKRQRVALWKQLFFLQCGWPGVGARALSCTIRCWWHSLTYNSTNHSYSNRLTLCVCFCRVLLVGVGNQITTPKGAKALARGGGVSCVQYRKLNMVKP